MEYGHIKRREEEKESLILSSCTSSSSWTYKEEGEEEGEPDPLILFCFLTERRSNEGRGRAQSAPKRGTREQKIRSSHEWDRKHLQLVCASSSSSTPHIRMSSCFFFLDAGANTDTSPLCRKSLRNCIAKR